MNNVTKLILKSFRKAFFSLTSELFTGYIHLVESKLKDLTILSRSPSMDPKFQQIAHYSKQLEVRLSSLNCKSKIK